MPPVRHSAWLHRFTAFSALSTLLLIGLGGLVTSKEAGMAVPDWPTTYGYNMFLFPIHLWTGGIFWEHTHRLFASYVGLLTTILMVWLLITEKRVWMKWLGVIAFVAVVTQGVLGGLRVRLIIDELGIPHAALAQLFLALLTAMTLFTGKWWRQEQPHYRTEKKVQPWLLVLATVLVLQLVVALTVLHAPGGFVACLLLVGLSAVALGTGTSKQPDSPTGNRRDVTTWLTATTILIFLQLMLAATIRHQHVGLAVPDFPLAYGQVWPDTSPEFLDSVNANRMELIYDKPIRPFDVHLHMGHRLVALAILGMVALCLVKSRGILGRKDLISRWVLVWFALTCLQGILGAVTVLKNKPADIATLHVVTGALLLNLGALLILVNCRLERAEKAPADSAQESISAPQAEPTGATAG